MAAIIAEKHVPGAAGSGQMRPGEDRCADAGRRRMMFAVAASGDATMKIGSSLLLAGAMAAALGAGCAQAASVMSALACQVLDQPASKKRIASRRSTLLINRM
jgi:hypothetical protein